MMNLWPDINDKMQKLPLEIVTEQSTAFDCQSDNAIGIIHRYLNELEFGIFPFDNKKNAISLFKVAGLSYPCKVHFDGTISKARTEAEFIGLVAKILNHQKTRQAIAELMK